MTTTNPSPALPLRVRAPQRTLRLRLGATITATSRGIDWAEKFPRIVREKHFPETFRHNVLPGPRTRFGQSEHP